MRNAPPPRTPKSDPVHSFWVSLREALGPKFAQDRVLGDAIKKLSFQLTEGRTQAPEYWRSEESLAAYTAYFLPLNFHKVRKILNENLKNLPTPGIGSRWLDFGSGPGTGALATLSAIAELPEDKRPNDIHITFFDNQPHVLDLAVKLAKNYAYKLGLDVKVVGVSDSEQLRGQSFDFLIAANVLNEMATPTNIEDEPISKLFEHTTRAILLVEPAHRVSSQKLIRFRARLLKKFAEDLKILAPCTHEAACPVFRSERDWCHFSDPVADEKLIDINKSFFDNPRLWLKYSYLFAVKPSGFGEDAEKLPKHDPKILRAIGDLHPKGEGAAIDLCEPESKKQIHLPISSAESMAKHLARGKLVDLRKLRK